MPHRWHADLGTQHSEPSPCQGTCFLRWRPPPPQVLCGNAEYAAQLGAELWPQLTAAYITSQLKPLKPSADTEVCCGGGGVLGYIGCSVSSIS